MTIERDYDYNQSPIETISLTQEIVEKLYDRGLITESSNESITLDNNSLKYLPEYQIEKIMKFQSVFSPSKALAKCSLVPIPNRNPRLSASVYPDGTIHSSFSGLMKCNNVLCPECNKELSFNRRELIQNRLLESKTKGHSINFGTLTIPRGIGLEDSISSLNSAYKSIIGNGLRAYCKRRGITEYHHSRSLDITICDTDRNPYHIHIHFLLITDKLVEGIKEYIWKRYKSFMKGLGIKVSKMGFDLKPIDTIKGIQNYLNKTISFELTSTKKIGKRNNSYGWMEWLSRISESPTKRQIAIYRTLVKESKGTRWWSKSKSFEVPCQFLKDKEMKEEQPIEVFSQEIGLNCWYALNEIREAKVLINILLKKKIENPEGDNSIFDAVCELLEKSRYEQFYSVELMNYYKDRIKKILSL